VNHQPSHEHQPTVEVDISATSAGWRYVGFQVTRIPIGTTINRRFTDSESVLVLQQGSVVITIGSESFTASRSSVFTDLASVVYAPPGVDITVSAVADISNANGIDAVVAIGSAPANATYPTRIVHPLEMKNEVRGGGQAFRQVIHTLAPPLPAHRLIVYEVYVPRGTWSGWPPHCHDGLDGSPYLEETYYFRFDRPEGFGIHRNWRVASSDRPVTSADDEFEYTQTVRDGEVALVPRGYHSSVACPGANMYFLNILAGELEHDARSTPPCFASEHTWIADDWDAGAWSLPIIGSYSK
jgi:5-deoxy-glucuronate isomerase